jgi:type IV secretory pathway VirB10-like protein
MPASLVKYVAELTATDMPIDSGVIFRCRTWLATNKHEISKCKTPLAMIASAAPIVDASINNKAKALDPTLTEACHAALKLPNPTHTVACHAALKLMAAEKAAEKAAKKAAAVVAAEAAAEAKLEARAKREEKGRLKAEAEADAWAENWADAWEWFPLVMRRRGSGERAAVARGRVRESRRRARAAARRGNELKPRSRTSRSCAARTSVRNCARAEECHARDVRRRHSRLAKIGDCLSLYTTEIY